MSGCKLGMHELLTVSEQVIDDAETHEELDAVSDAMMRMATRIAVGATHNETGLGDVPMTKDQWLRKCARLWDAAERDAAAFMASMSPGGNA